ncbi:MAG: isoleucine--tRNA ligase [Acholeplasmatales bacterium]|nr:isoleucine--tRNA ligase [Acholeplasmatales bacterium]
MSEFKDTVNLGHTDFEMRGNLNNKEPKIQEEWAKKDVYKKRLEKNEKCEQYTIHDGPPYANGAIHLGHALNKILKDIIVRYKNMNGFYSLYIPGWDTHGLPIENAIQKQGVNRKEMDTASFRDLCDKYAHEQVAKQMEGFKRLGVGADWEHPYISLQHEFERDQVRVFGKMVEKGLIYKGLKPVYWSPSSESALAEAEIEYKDITSKAIFFTFDLVDGKDALANAKLMVWTTTPWTLPCNVAVAANQEFEYVVFDSNKGRLVCAKSLLEKLSEKLGLENVVEVATVTGAELENLHVKHPLYDRESLVINADYVTDTDGTGFVHIAPGYGEDDYVAAKKYNLPILVYVDDHGVQGKEAGKYAGLFYEKSEDVIIEDMKENGSLLLLDPITHSYPHDWRTKKPVIFRATAQWFASIDPIKNEIMNAIHNEVKWDPVWGEVRLGNMIQDRHDWCISRQRAWGVPLPVFYCEDGEPVLDPEVIEHVAKIFEEFGSTEWYRRDAKDLLPEGYTNSHSPNGKFRKETDIMDVWFDSGSSYMTLFRRGLKFPADLYLEGSDQYRGWFNSSIITSVATFGHAPYKKVLSHGFTLDGKGQKMSKSLGNTVDPIKVCNQYGADILRSWAANVDFRSDMVMSEDLLKQVSDSYRKIRNTIKFLLANIDGFNPNTEAVPFEKLPSVDKYMLIRLNEFVRDVKASYDDFQFNDVCKLINSFVANELSSFYLDFTKDILYIEEEKSFARVAVQTVLYKTAYALITLIAPICPHTASEAYSFLPYATEEDAYLADLPSVVDYSKYDSLKANFDKFMNEYRPQILKALEEARANKVIGKSFSAKLTFTLDAAAKKLFEALDTNIGQILIVSQVEYVDGDSFEVSVSPAVGEVCERCRATVQFVNTNGLCQRCQSIVDKMVK